MKDWQTMWRRGAGAVAVGGLVASYLGERAAHDYQLVPKTVPVGTKMEESPSSTGGASQDIRILHLADTHFYRGREDLVAWVRELASGAGRDYDLVALTGDMLSSDYGDKILFEQAFRPLLESGVPGIYVYGSHDYNENKPGNPLKYLRGAHRKVASDVTEIESRRREVPDRARTPFGSRLREILGEAEWVNLNNRRAELRVGGITLQLSGVGDPHIRKDRYVGFGGELTENQLPSPWPAQDEGAPEEWLAPASDAKPAGMLRLGLCHAPYSRVLNSFAADETDLVLCGHTHGGQVCLPGGRALVSNTDLNPQFAAGVFSWIPAGKQGAERSRKAAQNSDKGFLSENEKTAGVADTTSVTGRPVAGFTDTELTRVVVSPGLGSSPFSPWRVCCPPTAYLLTLAAVR